MSKAPITITTIHDIETAGRDLRIVEGRARTIINDIMGRRVKVRIPPAHIPAGMGEVPPLQLEGKIVGTGLRIGEVRLHTSRGIRVVNLYHPAIEILELE